MAFRSAAGSPEPPDVVVQPAVVRTVTATIEAPAVMKLRLLLSMGQAFLFS
jgi:hypothetical protein